MFQFPGFPTYTYEFSACTAVLHCRGFPIRKSADRSLFAAPRSLSQLVASFFGSWCQGIHLMLFFAWTFSTFQFSLLNCLSFINKFLLVVNSFCEKVLSFLLSESIVPPFGEIVFYPNWKDLLIFANLLVKSSCPLICSFLTLQSFFIQFSMNVGLLALSYGLYPRFVIAVVVRTNSVELGGLKWTRTTDLALIRRAL